ncbi:protease inhibitor I42 family protein [Dokdonella sp. MW10]|uniref:protease inhibitor I42 family protein n=1 Tax=Dokdonella sp. MW10 TaxID=2992926 RepID=UPI003F81D171
MFRHLTYAILVWSAIPFARAAEVDLVAGPADAIVEVAAGDVLVVRVQGNASTGYAWQRVDDGRGVLVMDRLASPEGGVTPVPVPPADRRIGSPTTATYRYRAVKAGETELRLQYRRPWEKGAPAHELVWRVRVE